MSDYVVIYEQAEDGGWGAYIPDLPSVFALGKTQTEVADRIREAVAAYAIYMREHGESLPPPHHVSDVVAA